MKYASISIFYMFLFGITMDANHQTSSWLDPRLELRSSRLGGLGLVSTAPIAKDELVAIFGGIIINKTQVLQLSAESITKVLQIGDTLWISAPDSSADYINHSCEPNCGIKGQLFLVAIRDIAADEEITFDYAMTIAEWVGMEPFVCNCQTSSCRKKVDANDWKQETIPKKYYGYFSYYLQKKIDSISTSFKKVEPNQ